MACPAPSPPGSGRPPPPGGGRPFELDEDGESSRPRPPPPRPASGGKPEFEVEEIDLGGEDAAEPAAPAPPTPGPPRGGPPEPWWRPRRKGGRPDGEVDERTLAERRGTAVAVNAGRRPPPTGWPLEALRYPLRGPGPATAAALTVVWVLLDLAGRLNLLLGLLPKLLLLPVFLRWWFHDAAMGAAGRDRPAGWGSAMALGREQVVGIGRYLVAATVLLAPGLVVLLAFGRVPLGLVLLLAAALWLAAGALGQAVGDPGILKPWRAAAWLARRPLPLFVATWGGWAFGLAEWTVPGLPAGTTAGLLAALVGIRLGGLYMWLVSARALGVVGRDWTPWAEDEDPAV